METFPTLTLGSLVVNTEEVPELRALHGVPQPPAHHPEIDTWTHVLMALAVARQLTAEPAVHFAVLLHDLGKGTTPAAEWPRHLDHEERGVPLVRAVAQRLAVPLYWGELAALVCEHHTRCHRAAEMKGAGRRRLLRRLDAHAQPDLFILFLLACEADARGRLGLAERPYPQPSILRETWKTMSQARSVQVDQA